MRKYVTQVTERRINEMRNAGKTEGQLLFWALYHIKDFCGSSMLWSVKEAKDNGVRLDNEVQIKGHRLYKPILNGWAIKYSSIMVYTDTLGLNSWTIYDFNKLVSAVYAETM